MTAALFLIEPAVAAAAGVGDVLALSGPEGRHAVAVKRVGVGEHIALGDGAGTVLHAVVESLSGRDSLRARVQGRTDSPPPQPRIIVVQALPKGERGETAVETLTEVGVDVIVPWQAERAVARWTGDKAERGRAKWAAAARASAKQARRAWIPEIAPLARTSDVEALVATAACAIVLHEEAPGSLRDVAVPADGEVVLIVGPEGGLSPAELDRFTAAGAHLALLGPTVLRTSTAGTVAAAVLLAATPRWP
ncbi:MAG TPA: 16S rRNA (uracil(1498)-N(3))-methyltransferase [Motilibacterales bacterium]|nr:16S rRNA (uracil(1498)-N(3))-methyltransferase [Motilibacterales bacterium]